MGLYSPVLALPSAKKRFTTFLGVLSLWLLADKALAAPDLQTILTNISNIIVPLTAMVLLISYAAGAWMIIRALILLKNVGNISTSHQAQPGEMGKPLMLLVVGAVLCYLPTSTDALTNSLFSTGASIFGNGSINYQNLGTGATLLNYYPGGDTFGQQWQALANTLVLYIQFVGLLAMIKGWFILSHAAGQGGQQDAVAKGFTHIIGGIIAMNFVQAMNVLYNTIFNG